MAIDHYWSTLFKRSKLILFCFLAVGLGAYTGSRLMAPLYQSTALIQVTIHADNSQADINSLLASDQLVQTEAQLTVSDAVLRQVAAQHRDMSVEQLIREVTAVVKPNTQLFEINVLDTSAIRSAQLANDTAAVLIQQQDQFMQQSTKQSQEHIQQELQQTQKQIDTTTNQLNTLKERQDNSSRISALQTTLDNLHQHYQQRQTILTQLELTEAQSSSFLRVAQSAQPASRPAQPRVLFNTGIGLLAGLLTGLLLAMLLEQMDMRVRSEEALTQIVSWPVLTTVWRQDMLKKGKPVLDLSGEGTNAESYRMLRTNIGFSTVKRPVRSIVVVSATPHDGKSFIAASLAIFMARAGKKTLLIDADLRRPTIGKKFQLAAGTMGLSNAVLACSQSTTDSVSTIQPAHFSLDPYVHTVNTPNLFVMPSGPLPPNPPELFDSKAMESFFAHLTNSEFEIVLFDTPPLLGLSDTSILVSQADSVLAVIDVTTANKKNLKRMHTLLEQSKSHVIGCVINKQTPTRRDMAYTYAYYQDPQHAHSSQEDEIRSGESQEKEDSDRNAPAEKSAQTVLESQSQTTSPSVQPPSTQLDVDELAALKHSLVITSRDGFFPTEDGKRLYYQVMGHGSDTIVIPAASWMAADFELLAQTHTLIFYDQGGRGKSDAITDSSQISLWHQIHELEALRRYFALDSFSLIGWSYLGGVTALYARAYPQHVKRLVLVCPLSIRCYAYADINAIDSKARVDRDAVKRLVQMQREGRDKSDPVTYNRAYAKITRLPRQMGRPEALLHMKSDPWISPNEWPDTVAKFLEHFSNSLQQWDWRLQLASLPTPTLIVHGNEDLIPLASSQEWATTLPNARLLTLPGIGHYPWLESPETFFPLVDRFLNGDWSQEAKHLLEATS